MIDGRIIILPSFNNLWVRISFATFMFGIFEEKYDILGAVEVLKEV